jgi:predicted acylesterase/phospholipase RssA
MAVPLESIQHLCFGIGGLSGWAFLGALIEIEHELEAAGRTLAHQVHGVVGTSIGSLIGLGVVLRFGAVELCELLKRSQERGDIRELNARLNIFNIRSKKGIKSTDIIKLVVQAMLCHKLGAGKTDITMAELAKHTGKTFVAVAYNVSYGRGELLDHQTAPTLPVWKAICMSCAIPGVFHAVEHKGSYYIDGGVTNPLPLDVFPIEQTLAFQLTSDVEHIGTARNMPLPEFVARLVSGPVDTIGALMIAALPAAYRHRVVQLRVPSKPSATNNFAQSDAERDRLLAAGRIAGRRLFRQAEAMLAHAAHMYQKLRADVSTVTTNFKET